MVIQMEALNRIGDYRNQAAAMMVRALDINTSGRPDAGFVDVSNNHPNRSVINAVSDEGIIRGSDDRFRPGEAISRAQMAAVLLRGFELERSQKPMFTDVPRVFWSFTDISTIAANRIASGYPDGTFRPNNKTTRAQFSVFLENALKHAEGIPSHGETKYGQMVEVEGWTYTIQDNHIIRTNKEGKTENILTPEDIEDDYSRDDHMSGAGLLNNSHLIIHDGWIYYMIGYSTHFLTGNQIFDLYRITFDGTEKEQVVEGGLQAPYIYNDQLYYFGFHTSPSRVEIPFFRSDVDGSNREKLDEMKMNTDWKYHDVWYLIKYDEETLFYSTPEAVYERSLETGYVKRIHGRPANELYLNDDLLLIGEDDGLYSINRATGIKTKVQHDPVKGFEQFGNTLYIQGENRFYSWDLEARKIEMIEENMGESQWSTEKNKTNGVILRRDTEKLETHIYMIVDEKMVHHEIENGHFGRYDIPFINDVFYVLLESFDLAKTQVILSCMQEASQKKQSLLRNLNKSPPAFIGLKQMTITLLRQQVRRLILTPSCTEI